MTFVVVYDACVLYPSTLRDFLIRIAQSGLVQAKWTDKILDEAFDSLRTNRPDLPPNKLARTRALMNGAVRDCLVKGHEPLIGGLELPDPDDRHVLAAAIKSKAQLIVTFNTRDFPASALQPWGVEARTPDEFVIAQIDLWPKQVREAIEQIASAWSGPHNTPADVLASLKRCGMDAAVDALAELIGS